jgi:hypothetical protein
MPMQQPSAGFVAIHTLWTRSPHQKSVLFASVFYYQDTRTRFLRINPSEGKDLYDTF